MPPRYWFLVFGDRQAFGGAAFVPAPREAMTRAGIDQAVRDAGLPVPLGLALFDHPCPFDFTPPAAYADRLLTEDEWRAFWTGCAGGAA